jgi:hypothetical protein
MLLTACPHCAHATDVRARMLACVQGTRWVSEPFAIVRHYLLGWFIIDFMSIAVAVFDIILIAVSSQSAPPRRKWRRECTQRRDWRVGMRRCRNGGPAVCGVATARGGGESGGGCDVHGASHGEGGGAVRPRVRCDARG